MINSKRRIQALSFIIALSLLLCLFSGLVYAKAEIIEEGVCSDTIHWSLDNTGVLEISGKGAMPDYSEEYKYQYINDDVADPWGYKADNPWFSIRKKIKKVVIQEGITSLGSCTFYDCTNLTEVSVPKSLTFVGKDTFHHCENLESFSFAEGTKTIAPSTFVFCSDLKTVRIPSTVERIESGAFWQCGLEEINLPDSLEYIGQDAFFQNQLKEIVIPNGITEICNGAFARNYALTRVILPEGLTRIGDGAFEDCRSLESIELPDSINEIGLSAFDDCIALHELRIPEGVTSLVAPFDNSGVEKVYLPSTIESLYSVFHSLTEDEIEASKNGNSVSGLYKLTDVFYAGTKEKWETVSVQEGNELLDTVSMHFLDDDKPDVPNYNDNEKPLEKSIAIYCTKKTLNLNVGETMGISFSLISNGILSENWEKMAISISDPSVVSLSEYKQTVYGFTIDVKGLKTGETSLVITDTETGTSRIETITVSDELSKGYSFSLFSLPSEHKGTILDRGLLTNIYDLNGLFVNNYSCSFNTNTKEYDVSFDVYNQRYHYGAVDIFDENGRWVDSKEIQQNSEISSLWDTGEQIYYLVTDAVTGKSLTYESGSLSKHTSISISVPKGGYFTISNNMAESIGTFFFNVTSIVMDAVVEAIDFHYSDDRKVSAVSDFVDGTVNGFEDEAVDIYKLFTTTATKEIKAISKNFTFGTAKETCVSLTGVWENFTHALDLEWKHLFESSLGIAESVFKKISGPAGAALEVCFDFSDSLNKLSMVIGMAKSIDKPSVTVSAPESSESSFNSYGISVDSRNEIDKEAVLQVFGISNNPTVEVLLDDKGLTNYELYNICFVKDDKVVQPSGKVKVFIPIPAGMNKDGCYVYRQELDGSWQILDSMVEGNYLTFETDHFSLYAIAGNPDRMEIVSLPKKTTYAPNEAILLDGMILKCGDQIVSSGFYSNPSVAGKVGKEKIEVVYGFSKSFFTINVLEEEPPATPDNPVTPDEPAKPDEPSTPDDTKPTPAPAVKNGVVKGDDGKWALYKDDKVNTSYTGIAKNEYGWWRIVEGYVDFNATGIYKNEFGWWRVEDGKVNFEADGIYRNEYGWWKTTNGKVTFDETGVFKNEYGWWRVEDSKVDFSADGIYKNEYGWWKTTDGKVTFVEDGVFKNEYGWWKVDDSKVDFKFTGIAKNKYGTWYVKNGKVDFNKNGKVKFEGKTYTVKNGKVQ